jgi:hypothetical protein
MVMTTEIAHRLHQKFPKKHNHYALRDFFQFNPDFGTITDWNDTRNVLTSEDFIIGLLEGTARRSGRCLLRHHVQRGAGVGQA